MFTVLFVVKKYELILFLMLHQSQIIDIIDQWFEVLKLYITIVLITIKRFL